MRTGDKILNYSVTRRIKAGGMGVVFEGEQTWGSRRKVAIKQLLENLRDDDVIRRRFIREAEILEMLDNPYIVRILGFDHENDAFVMEFVDGQTVSDVLRHETRYFREPNRLVLFFGKLLDAFTYAHQVELILNGQTEKGIVHRDIKPSNIIIQPDGSPKILDFGISRVASFQSTLTDPKLQMGSVPYMSPEQITTPTDVDWRSDIYSLGVTLWEMLTGKSPYPRVTTHEVVVEVQRQIRFVPLPSLEQIVNDKNIEDITFLRKLDLIIAKATAKDRTHRYQDCSEMKIALVRALEETKNDVKKPERVHIADEETVVRQPYKKPQRVVLTEPPAHTTSENVQENIVKIGQDGTVIPQRTNHSGKIYIIVGIIILVGGLLWWFSQQHSAKENAASTVDEASLTQMMRADSCHSVADSYYTAKNYAKAAEFYKQAAELGNSDSQNMLGTMYQYGQGLPTDLDQAKSWFKTSAEHGNAEGQKNLAYLFAEAKDFTQALKWYRASAEQNNSDAQANLGVLYENGWGSSIDLAEALKWYGKAANQGYALAQYYMGTMHATGKGVPKNLSKAIQWYRLAARQGEPNAQQELRRLQVE